MKDSSKTEKLVSLRKKKTLALIIKSSFSVDFEKETSTAFDSYFLNSSINLEQYSLNYDNEEEIIDLLEDLPTLETVYLTYLLVVRDSQIPTAFFSIKLVAKLSDIATRDEPLTNFCLAVLNVFASNSSDLAPLFVKNNFISFLYRNRKDYSNAEAYFSVKILTHILRFVVAQENDKVYNKICSESNIENLIDCLLSSFNERVIGIGVELLIFQAITDNALELIIVAVDKLMKTSDKPLYLALLKIFHSLEGQMDDKVTDYFLRQFGDTGVVSALQTEENNLEPFLRLYLHITSANLSDNANFDSIACLRALNWRIVQLSCKPKNKENNCLTKLLIRLASNIIYENTDKVLLFAIREGLAETVFSLLDVTDCLNVKQEIIDFVNNLVVDAYNRKERESYFDNMSQLKVAELLAEQIYSQENNAVLKALYGIAAMIKFYLETAKDLSFWVDLLDEEHLSVLSLSPNEDVKDLAAKILDELDEQARKML